MNINLSSMYDGASVLVTGGTGSFGHAFVKDLLAKTKVERIVIFSRDEMKQWAMENNFNDPRLRFFIGDVRDRNRLYRAFKGIDIVIHAAATKIVPVAEYNPIECVKTNVMGAINVIDAALDREVENVVALSTDKASSPVNLYGATKLTSDKLFTASNNYVGAGSTKLSVVRYGNVMGSRGSVIPFFKSLLSKGATKLPITDERMTRFMISLPEGVDLVHLAVADSVGGEIYVKKIPSMRVVDIAKALSPSAELEHIGIRPGEKLHEQMISVEDALSTYEYEAHYKILPQINNWDKCEKRIADGIKVSDSFIYSSEKNTQWMTKEQLNHWVETSFFDMLKV